MPNTKTRDSIERALTQAAQNGQIKSWERLKLTYANAPKWAIHLTAGAVGPDGTGRIEVRTYNEAHFICAILASAHLGEQTRSALPGWTVTDLETLVIAAGELWDGTGDPEDLMGSRRRGVLDQAAAVYRENADLPPTGTNRDEAEEFRCPRCHHVHDAEFSCDDDCVTCAIRLAEDEEATGEPCEI